MLLHHALRGAVLTIQTRQLRHGEVELRAARKQAARELVRLSVRLGLLRFIRPRSCVRRDARAAQRGPARHRLVRPQRALTQLTQQIERACVLFVTCGEIPTFTLQAGALALQHETLLLELGRHRERVFRDQRGPFEQAARFTQAPLELPVGMRAPRKLLEALLHVHETETRPVVSFERRAVQCFLLFPLFGATLPPIAHERRLGLERAQLCVQLGQPHRTGLGRHAPFACRRRSRARSV